jgi:hemolysin activation/secretion protein
VDPQTQLNTPNTYMEFSVDSANVWRSERRQWTLDMSANFGSRDVVGDSDHFALARYQGRPNFFYLRGSGSMTTALPGGLQFITKVAAQGAVEPLVSNEYFSIAGSDGVRGYLEAEEFGDVAVKGTLQLESPQLHARAGALTGKAFAFFDDGHVTFIAPLLGQPDHADLRSAGLGIQVLGGSNYTGLLTWAYPLLSGPRTHSGDSRVLFVVRGSL